MKSEVPSQPIVFLKPSSAVIFDGERIVIPGQSSDVHHEVELVLMVGRKGKFIPSAEAGSYIAGYAVGLDMTARDIQATAKSKRHPWTVAKGFDTFAPLGRFLPSKDVPDICNARISLSINGEYRQDGSTADMIFSPRQLVSYCSEIFTLEEGDIIYTGTPAGVGPIRDGDRLEAVISGLPPLSVSVEERTHGIRRVSG